ncbi:unnamed protein product [Bursaphelenchus xylophilus]|uniref:(pine wood nematode) hypothetical protein n=1 Tax=Bursaphelenchus xylophilus TaxID=6326 RepID=A0A1I7S8B3_BURXY|nr:unnamed protein product [Bursaphelenchus xylophilus]CAG9080318.1 unnamed protein product [Bursaphelenchus xylophilus]
MLEISRTMNFLRFGLVMAFLVLGLVSGEAVKKVDRELFRSRRGYGMPIGEYPPPPPPPPPPSYGYGNSYGYNSGFGGGMWGRK